ncbi:methyl-accepting chemotaxis protein [Vibrio maerlii]|uniref:methyl-accepting chemotaxis protein n=1 Tax=Vibrio maerlii TaxID=2231648 RepID=UPI001F12AFDD|nr:methyl-accepting chemotaxis protein [Vibrio maerlii]
MGLKNISIKLKLQLIVLLTGVLIILMSVLSLLLQKEQQLSERRNKLEDQIETAVSLVEYYRNRSDLSSLQAQQMAKQALSSLRYEDNNYFWITDTANNLVMHPLRPSSIGNDMTNIQDGAGQYHWREMSRIATTTGRGGLDYLWIAPNGEEHDKISYVSYIAQWDWIIGSGLFVSDLDDAFTDQVILQASLALFILLIMFVANMIIGNSIIKPIDKLLVRLQDMSNGDLTNEIKLNRRDEVGQLSQSLSKLQSTMLKTLTLSTDTALKASTLSQSIASTSEENASSIASQNYQLEQISTAMTEMSSTIQEVGSNAEHTSKYTNDVARLSKDCSDSMNSTLEEVTTISNSINETSQLMNQLKQGVDNIGAVVQVINEVSEQTSLLALNAAIEAARAGEQGRGFAVVSDEVRNLASRTQASTDEVQKTINTLYSQADKVVAVMEANNVNINSTVVVANETKEALNNMEGALDQTNNMVAQIAAAAEQQGSVANDMSENVSTIHLSTGEISQATEHLAIQIQEMVILAEELQQQLNYFKLS